MTIKQNLIHQLEQAPESTLYALREQPMEWHQYLSPERIIEDTDGQISALEEILNSIWFDNVIEDLIRERFYQEQRRENPYHYHGVKPSDFMTIKSNMRLTYLDIF